MTKLICPECGEEIDYLITYSLEENKQELFFVGKKNDEFDWSSSEPVEGTCQRIIFVCPYCEEELYRNNGSSNDKEIIKILKSKTPEKVSFT